jgi:hypothetical protein
VQTEQVHQTVPTEPIQPAVPSKDIDPVAFLDPTADDKDEFARPPVGQVLIIDEKSMVGRTQMGQADHRL